MQRKLADSEPIVVLKGADRWTANGNPFLTS